MKKDYCLVCKHPERCKTCRKSPFRDSLKGLRDDYDSRSGGPDNLLIAIIGTLVILIIMIATGF